MTFFFSLLVVILSVKFFLAYLCFAPIFLSCSHKRESHLCIFNLMSNPDPVGCFCFCWYSWAVMTWWIHGPLCLHHFETYDISLFTWCFKLAMLFQLMATASHNIIFWVQMLFKCFPPFSVCLTMVHWIAGNILYFLPFQYTYDMPSSLIFIPFSSTNLIWSGL